MAPTELRTRSPSAAIFSAASPSTAYFSTAYFSGALLSLGAACLGITLWGCGGSKTEPESAAPAQAEEAPEEQDMSDEEAALLAQIEESAAIADSEAAQASGEPQQSENTGDGPPERETVYRVSPDGLKIQIEGAEFLPKAEAIRVAGGWGVKLTVQATTKEEKVLYSAAEGPLAFGGYVSRSSREKFGDSRKGGGELKLSPGPAIQFSRTWPKAGEKGLASGETLELHVGLWGFGENEKDTRPVHKFIVVRMVGGQGATPVVEPPS